MDTDQSLVLACIDGSSVTSSVVDYSSWIANTTQRPLKFLHTIEHHSYTAHPNLSGAIGPGSRDDLLEELSTLEQQRSHLLIKQGNNLLQKAKERAEKNAVANIELCQRHGELAENLIDLEDKIKLAVVGIRGESREHEVGISTKLESIIRAIHKPVLVVNKEFMEPKELMFAYDHSPACQKALSMFIESRLFKGTRCHLVHALQGGAQQAEGFLDDAANLLQQAGINCITAQVQGQIDEALAQYQNDKHIDLMIMGAFSHNRMRNLLMGSFTATMLEKTQSPLLLLR